MVLLFFFHVEHSTEKWPYRPMWSKTVATLHLWLLKFLLTLNNIKNVVPRRVAATLRGTDAACLHDHSATLGGTAIYQ